MGAMTPLSHMRQHNSGVHSCDMAATAFIGAMHQQQYSYRRHEPTWRVIALTNESCNSGRRPREGIGVMRESCHIGDGRESNCCSHHRYRNKHHVKISQYASPLNTLWHNYECTHSYWWWEQQLLSRPPPTWHDTSTCVTWLIHLYAKTHSCARQGLFIGAVKHLANAPTTACHVTY